MEVENNPNDPAAGTRPVSFSKHLYIEQEDFLETPVPKYKRLYPTAVAASTQWMVAPFTLRPSAGFPPRDSGSYSARTSTTLPASSLTPGKELPGLPELQLSGGAGWL